MATANSLETKMLLVGRGARGEDRTYNRLYVGRRGVGTASVGISALPPFSSRGPNFLCKVAVLRRK